MLFAFFWYSILSTVTNCFERIFFIKLRFLHISFYFVFSKREIKEDFKHKSSEKHKSIQFFFSVDDFRLFGASWVEAFPSTTSLTAQQYETSIWILLKENWEWLRFLLLDDDINRWELDECFFSLPTSINLDLISLKSLSVSQFSILSQVLYWICSFFVVFFFLFWRNISALSLLLISFFIFCFFAFYQFEMFFCFYSQLFLLFFFRQLLFSFNMRVIILFRKRYLTWY